MNLIEIMWKEILIMFITANKHKIILENFIETRNSRE